MSNPDDDQIEVLADAIAKRLAKLEPFEYVLWDLNDIARYLHRNKETVRQRMVCLPSFPKAIRVPAGDAKRPHPRYYAKEVVEWAKKHQDKN
jgi:hypothetical protein